MTEKECAWCVWFDETFLSPGDGFCKKRGPVFGANGFGAWPAVVDVDYCGDFEYAEGREFGVGDEIG